MTGAISAGRPVSRTLRWRLTVLVAAAAGFAGPGVASAHVTAHGEQLEKGGEGSIVPKQEAATMSWQTWSWLGGIVAVIAAAATAGGIVQARTLRQPNHFFEGMLS